MSRGAQESTDSHDGDRSDSDYVHDEFCSNLWSGTIDIGKARYLPKVQRTRFNDGSSLEDLLEIGNRRESPQSEGTRVEFFRDDMNGLWFDMVPLPLIGLCVSFCFLLFGVYLCYYAVSRFIVDGFGQALSPMITGIAFVGSFCTMVGAVGCISTRFPVYSWHKIKKEENELNDPDADGEPYEESAAARKGRMRRSQWLVHGVELIKIGISTGLLCFTAHDLALNLNCIMLHFRGHPTADGRKSPWYPSGHDVGRVLLAYNGFYVALVLLYFGLMNCLRSLSRRARAARGYRKTCTMIWRTNVTHRGLMKHASQESMGQRSSSQAFPDVDELFDVNSVSSVSSSCDNQHRQFASPIRRF